MWKKLENLKKIDETGIVLIIRLDDEQEVIKVADAAIEGGIKVLEIPMAVPNALGVIKELSKKYKDEGIVIGAGTVCEAETARAAILAGASLLVSPQLNTEMIKMANSYQVITASGAYTPTEFFATMEAGADIIKLFPTDYVGPAYVKSIKAPLEQAPIMPSGGVTPENVKEWFEAGVACVAVGSFITKAAQKDGNYTKVTEAAKQFLQIVKECR